ncbi:DegT/DnrJ/EryC1/StrS family aminotransferase [Rhodophyticola sp.]|uniref:DegT/DnrJ/EryC1/StrS family aminotransferase n=1 Tax=Rhodophyticola sp. TaxID=2680032 RepID=UPI003D2A645E
MPRLGLREWVAVGRVIAHGDLLRTSSNLGLCQKFERSLARRMGARHALAVNNGTAALITALQACRIGPGDEVRCRPIPGWPAPRPYCMSAPCRCWSRSTRP